MVMPAGDLIETRFRRLGPADRGAVARIASSAFHGNAFYRKALGLDGAGFAGYWDAFFELSLASSAAAVFGLEHGGQLVSAVAVAFDGFPERQRAVLFAWKLLRRIGIGSLLRYLRFVRDYSRVMHRSRPEHRIEACALWFFTDPQAVRTGLGTRLARQAIEAIRTEGKLLITGFIDAGDPPLARYYRRLGFSVSPPFPFAGMKGARIEMRLAPPEAKTDAEDDAA